jgi:hypothetical protein
VGSQDAQSKVEGERIEDRVRWYVSQVYHDIGKVGHVSLLGLARSHLLFALFALS